MEVCKSQAQIQISLLDIAAHQWMVQFQQGVQLPVPKVKGSALLKKVELTQ